MAKAVHDGDNPFGSEKPHQIVFERDVENRFSRVALTSGSASQLAIDSSGFVSFRSEDEQSSAFPHSLAEFDIRTASCHVGRNRYGTFFTCVGNDLCFLLMLFCVEDTVADFFRP